MLTAETMRRIAPKQGDLFAQRLLEQTADVLERLGLKLTIEFLVIGENRVSRKSERAAFAQLLEVMRSPEVIDEWTPIGEGET